jgi:phosphopantetheinyl transferase
MQKKLEKQDRLKREEQQRREQHLAKAHAHTQANLAQSGIPGVSASAYNMPPSGSLFFDYSNQGRPTRHGHHDR